MTKIDTAQPQQTICDDCGRWIDHNAAQWTDDGASYCASCRTIPACDRIDTAKEREKLAALEGHTPGPWEVVMPRNDLWPQRVFSGSSSICMMGSSGHAQEHRVNNARLITAAPDLKETVAKLRDALDAKDAVIAQLMQRRENAEEILTGEILSELTRARAKFPGKNVTFAALVEEVGELATATFEECADRVRDEAVQVAVMAMRMVLDGDHSFELWREEKGLDPLDPALRARAALNPGEDK